MSISISLRTRSHVFICSDRLLSESILQIKDTEDRTHRLGSVLIDFSGPAPDTHRLSFLAVERSKHTALTHRTPPSPEMVARITQGILHSSLRSRPINCSAIVAGISADTTALYCIDQYGACFSDNFATTGYGLYFLYGIYDAFYREDFSEEDAHGFLQRCLSVLKEHLYIKTTHWRVSSLSVDGEFKTQLIQ